MFVAGMWFQDLWTYDFRRTEMCIIPYATQMGEISFCAYNTGVGWRQIVENMHQNATVAEWYKEHGKHAVYANPNKAVPLPSGAVRFEIPDALVDVGVDRMIRLRQVARVEQRLAHVLRVVAADGIRKNRHQVVDADLGRLHQQRIVERPMHLARMNQAPAVAKPVRVVALHVKALVGVVLENGHGVVASFHQEIDGL